MSTRIRWSAAVAVLSIVGSLAACGGGTSNSAVLVRVGKNVITKSMLDHVIALQIDEHNGPFSQHPGPSHEELVRLGLDSLISFEWVTGEAVDLGLGATDQEVRKQFEQRKAATFRNDAEFRQYLATSGKTVEDELSRVKSSLATERILQAVNAKVGPITQAQVVRYYDEHKSQFAVPERRDIEAIRTWTKAAITNAEREVRSGVSFASVAKRVSIDRPYNAKGGLMVGLVRGQEEKGFDEAIFAAKPNVLTGPLYLRKRYYVFEVKKITPGRQESLAQVEATIRQQLPVELQRQALGEFIQAWRRKWIAKTDCSPGYVVQKCRQFRPDKRTVPEEPYSLR